MKNIPESLDLFISPLNGDMALQEDYILIGDKSNIAIPHLKDDVFRQIVMSENPSNEDVTNVGWVDNRIAQAIDHHQDEQPNEFLWNLLNDRII